MKNTILVVLLFITVTPLAPAADRMQVAAERYVKEITDKVERLRGSGAAVNQMTGYWQSDGGGYPYVTVSAEQMIVLYQAQKDGTLMLKGAGEHRGDHWRGFWKYRCAECCPTASFYGVGDLKAERNQSAINLTISGKRIDPATCEKSDEPDEVSYRLERIKMLSFAPFPRGNLVHTVTVIPGGYQMSFKPRWNAGWISISKVTITNQGYKVREMSSELVSVQEVSYGAPMPINVLLTAYDQKNRPIHTERASLPVF